MVEVIRGPGAAIRDPAPLSVWDRFSFDADIPDPMRPHDVRHVETPSVHHEVQRDSATEIAVVVDHRVECPAVGMVRCAVSVSAPTADLAKFGKLVNKFLSTSMSGFFDTSGPTFEDSTQWPVNRRRYGSRNVRRWAPQRRDHYRAQSNQSGSPNLSRM